MIFTIQGLEKEGTYSCHLAAVFSGPFRTVPKYKQAGVGFGLEHGRGGRPDKKGRLH